MNIFELANRIKLKMSENIVLLEKEHSLQNYNSQIEQNHLILQANQAKTFKQKAQTEPNLLAASSGDRLQMKELQKDLPDFWKKASEELSEEEYYSQCEEQKSDRSVNRAAAQSQELRSELSSVFEDALDELQPNEKLELQNVYFRDRLPAPRNLAAKPDIWQVIKSSIGKDLSRIAIPVYYNEPLSFLQRFTEDLEYSCLIDSASASQSPDIRIAYIAAIPVSSYSSSKGRT